MIESISSVKQPGRFVPDSTLSRWLRSENPALISAAREEIERRQYRSSRVYVPKKQASLDEIGHGHPLEESKQILLGEKSTVSKAYTDYQKSTPNIGADHSDLLKHIDTSWFNFRQIVDLFHAPNVSENGVSIDFLNTCSYILKQEEVRKFNNRLLRGQEVKDAYNHVLNLPEIQELVKNFYKTSTQEQEFTLEQFHKSRENLREKLRNEEQITHLDSSGASLEDKVHDVTSSSFTSEEEYTKEKSRKTRYKIMESIIRYMSKDKITSVKKVSVDYYHNLVRMLYSSKPTEYLKKIARYFKSVFDKNVNKISGIITKLLQQTTPVSSVVSERENSTSYMERLNKYVRERLGREQQKPSKTPTPSTEVKTLSNEQISDYETDQVLLEQRLSGFGQREKDLSKEGILSEQNQLPETAYTKLHTLSFHHQKTLVDRKEYRIGIGQFDRKKYELDLSKDKRSTWNISFLSTILTYEQDSDGNLTPKGKSVEPIYLQGINQENFGRLITDLKREKGDHVMIGLNIPISPELDKYKSVEFILGVNNKYQDIVIFYENQEGEVKIFEGKDAKERMRFVENEEINGKTVTNSYVLNTSVEFGKRILLLGTFKNAHYYLSN